MSNHRNPRPKVPKRPPINNPPRRSTRGRPLWTVRDRRELADAYRAFLRGNPRAASAVLDALEVIATSDRRRAQRLVEAASAVVSSIRGRS